MLLGVLRTLIRYAVRIPIPIETFGALSFLGEQIGLHVGRDAPITSVHSVSRGITFWFAHLE